MTANDQEIQDQLQAAAQGDADAFQEAADLIGKLSQAIDRLRATNQGLTQEIVHGVDLIRLLIKHLASLHNSELPSGLWNAVSEYLHTH